METWVFDTLARFDLANFIAICVVLLIGYIRICKKMDGRFEKVDQKFEKVDQRFDKIEGELVKIREKVAELDKDVYGINITLRSKECCILHHGEQRKAE
jgi:uncharacterized protein YoxC